MKKTTIFFITILFAINGLNAKPVTLRLNLQKGQKFTHEITVNTKFNVQMSNMSVEFEFPMFLDLNYEVMSENSSDTIVLKTELDALKIDFDMFGQKFKFDSNDTTNFDDKFSGILKDMLHKPFEIHYDKYRNITDIVGLDTVFKKNAKFNNNSEYTAIENEQTVNIDSIINANTEKLSSNPLYVINGVPCDNTINEYKEVWSENRKMNLIYYPCDYDYIKNALADEIVSATVLNKTTSISLYKERGEGGIVLITTKDENPIPKIGLETERANKDENLKSNLYNVFSLVVFHKNSVRKNSQWESQRISFGNFKAGEIAIEKLFKVRKITNENTVISSLSQYFIGFITKIDGLEFKSCKENGEVTVNNNSGWTISANHTFEMSVEANYKDTGKMLITVTINAATISK